MSKLEELIAVADELCTAIEENVLPLLEMEGEEIDKTSEKLKSMIARLAEATTEEKEEDSEEEDEAVVVEASIVRENVAS